MLLSFALRDVFSLWLSGAREHVEIFIYLRGKKGTVVEE